MGETEDLLVIVGGHAVARVIIKHDKSQAISAACAAASHISTPADIQLCTFSDGAQDRDYHGGAALAYRESWLPQGWGKETRPIGFMVCKAWPFGHAAASLAMEGVGVLESLSAANEELKQHLPVLTNNASTVNVKVTTDCQDILRRISGMTMLTGNPITFPPQLIIKIHELILALHGHGIKVIVELHWCPRNAVPSLSTADAMATNARKTGLGFCSASKNLWFWATQSVIMKELEPMLLGTVRFARLPLSQNQTGAGSTGTTESKTKKGRRAKKVAQRANAPDATHTDATKSHLQFPLPAIPLPPKPQFSKPVTTFNTEATISNAGKTRFNAVSSTISSIKPKATQSDEVEAGKRKTEEDMEESEAKPVKKVKLSPAEMRKRQTEVVEMEESEGLPNKEADRSPTSEAAEPCSDREVPPTAGSAQRLAHTMPAAWRLPPTKTYVKDGRGVVREKLVHPAPYIRIALASTKETGERNVFISDGVSPFSLANPEGVYLEARMEEVWTVVSKEDGHEG